MQDYIILNSNCRFLLRTRRNKAKTFYDPLDWDALYRIFLIVEMLRIFLFTWSVHYDKAHFFNYLNRKILFTSQKSMYQEQKEVIFRSGIYIFGRISLFFLLFLKISFQGDCLRILFLKRSGDI